MSNRLSPTKRIGGGRSKPKNINKLSVNGFSVSYVGGFDSLGPAYAVWYLLSDVDSRQMPPYEEMDLKRMTLTELSSAIGDRSITHMCIEGEIPDSLSLLTPNLTELRLENVTSFPPILDGFRLLRKVHINNSKFPHGLPEHISQLPALLELKLTHCYLSTLPYSLKRLRKLQILDASDNSFAREFPGCIPEMSSLTNLNLSKCHLSEIPDMLRSLTNLKLLDVSYNDFAGGQLPSCIAELSSLQELSINHCNLLDLPDGLQSLTQLSSLDLSDNNFSGGLPCCVVELRSLTVLRVGNCQLLSLPNSLANLKSINILNLSLNKFEILPPVICELTDLRVLTLGSMYANETLTELDPNLLKLSKLAVVDCRRCEALKNPPYGVCEQGVEAIKKFYEDMKDGKSKQVVVSTVAVIGELMSGKTSLIRSLKNGKRELTYRDDISELDETTTVFEMNELELQRCRLRIVDFGGHPVYHMAYQMTLKDSCIPLIVVSMEQYCNVRKIVGEEEAARRVCFDWMSHLYLSCPRLGNPFLIITHEDKFSDADQFESLQKELVEGIEKLRKEFLAEQSELDLPNNFHKILHFENTSIPLFNTEDTFVFGIGPNELSNINRLKESLDKYCERFKVVIPHLWDQVGSYIESVKDKPFLAVSEIKNQFPEGDQLVILRYLHNIGKILWYEDQQSLAHFVFHQITAITDMVALLFHHSGFKKWDERFNDFHIYRYKNFPVDLGIYEELVEEFKNTGKLDDVILFHLFDKESRFGYDTSMAIIQAFYLIHGPIEHIPRPVYILPYFSSNVKTRSFERDGDLQLKADISFKGLTLPKYVHHLLTVAVFNMHANSDRICYKYSLSNGATIQHGDSTTHLLHDFDNRKVTIQISTSISDITASWKLLADTCKTIIRCSKKHRKATRPVVRLFCCHCLFLRDPKRKKPGSKLKPDWVYPDAFQTGGKEEAKSYSNAKCFNQTSGDSKPTVPSPLIGPCREMNEKEMKNLQMYLDGLRRHVPSSTGAAQRSAAISSSATGADTPYPLANLLLSEADQLTAAGDITTLTVGASAADPLPPRLPSVDQNEDRDSNLSDDGTFMDEENKCQATISYRLKPCIRQKIRSLFNTDSVYKMTGPTRGRCLIINNNKFDASPSEESQLEERVGSEVDVTNITNVFEALSFECEVLRDLNGQAMLDEITKETRRQEHSNHGMFILVIMTHGGEEDVVYGTDGKAVKHREIYERMYTYNFPKMAEKPKVIILQACAGQRTDLMEQSAYYSPPMRRRAEDLREAITKEPPPPTSPSACFSGPEPGKHTSFDGIYVMKASVPGYISHRHKTHGTWFIRAVVEVLYKHSCHRDLRSLFEQIQKKVRNKTMSVHCRYPDIGAQVPTDMCWLIPGKKLYLFPGYNPVKKSV